MTKAEAIDILDNLIGMVTDSQGHDYDKAFKMAIRSLKAWEKVLKAVDENEFSLGVSAKIYITWLINKHLKEVEDE